MSDTTSSIPFVNPATGEQFGEIASTPTADVAHVVDDMRRAYRLLRRKSASERAWILNGFKEHLIERADEIAAVLNQDCGKTMQDGMVETFITVDTLSQIVKNASRWLKRKSIPRGLYMFKNYYTKAEPYGVVAVLGPWNYPFVQVMTPVLAAFAAGNTVVIKSSEVTPAVGKLIEDLFAGYGPIAPYVRVVHGDGRVGAALVSAPPDLIFMTGSGGTARKIMQSTVETLTPFIHELGGKDAMLVLADADVKQAAKWGVWASFYHSGQVCMSVERVYVVDAVYDQFVEAVLEEVAKFKIGYDTDKISPNNCGPMTSEAQIGIVEDHVADAVAKGARVLSGGGREGMFVDPVVLVDVDHTMKGMREETFGPTMPIMKVKDTAEAVALANDSDYGLCAYIWSRNLREAQYVGNMLDAGSIVINDAMAHYAVSQLPFGGRKQSGNGRIHGAQEVLQFTQPKSFAVGPPPSPFDIATIFRGPGHYENMKRLMKLVFGSNKQRIEAIIPRPDGESDAGELEQGGSQAGRQAAWTLLGALGICAIAVAALIKRR